MNVNLYQNNELMENYNLENDMTLLYITATSFPEGVLKAHQELHALIPFSKERSYYGVSNPDSSGKIIYKAAAEELDKSESKKLELDSMILKKGNYISIYIANYQNDIPAIGTAFEELLKHPNIDPQGCCVEWYISDNDVKCMIRLKDK